MDNSKTSRPRAGSERHRKRDVLRVELRILVDRVFGYDAAAAAADHLVSHSRHSAQCLLVRARARAFPVPTPRRRARYGFKRDTGLAALALSKGNRTRTQPRERHPKPSARPDAARTRARAHASMALVAPSADHACWPNSEKKFVLPFGKQHYYVPASAVHSLPKRGNKVPDGKALGSLGTRRPRDGSPTTTRVASS